MTCARRTVNTSPYATSEAAKLSDDRSHKTEIDADGCAGNFARGPPRQGAHDPKGWSVSIFAPIKPYPSWRSERSTKNRRSTWGWKVNLAAGGPVLLAPGLVPELPTAGWLAAFVVAGVVRVMTTALRHDTPITRSIAERLRPGNRR